MYHSFNHLQGILIFDYLFYQNKYYNSMYYYQEVNDCQIKANPQFPKSNSQFILTIVIKHG